MKNLFEHAQNITMTTRAKNKVLTLKIMIRYQNEKKSKQKKHKSRIKTEDLMLVKNKIRDNQKERKLNFR
jgi:hypothetical protein